MTQDTEVDRETVPIILAENERNLISQLDFQAAATLQVFQIAVDFWLDPDTIHGQPKALASVIKKAIVVREQIQRIKAVLPSIETHANIHIRELFEPASQFLIALQQVDDSTTDMITLMQRHMSQDLPEVSPARDQFTKIANQLELIITSARPSMKAIQDNLAYDAYRNTTNEADRRR